MATGGTRRRSPSVVNALSRALREADTEPADAALVALAKQYAAQIDAAGEAGDGAGDPAVLIKLTPGLLAILEQLGMTPKARGTAAPPGPSPGAEGGGSGDSPTARRSGFDQRRARAATRLNGATPLDPATA